MLATAIPQAGLNTDRLIEGSFDFADQRCKQGPSIASPLQGSRPLWRGVETFEPGLDEAKAPIAQPLELQATPGKPRRGGSPRGCRKALMKPCQGTECRTQL
jgi:hypothetical protein